MIAGMLGTLFGAKSKGKAREREGGRKGGMEREGGREEEGRCKYWKLAEKKEKEQE